MERASQSVTSLTFQETERERGRRERGRREREVYRECTTEQKERFPHRSLGISEYKQTQV